MTLVPPFGKTPNKWMIIGEAPGADEARSLKPFVGAAGREQQQHLIRNGLLQSQFRLANIYPIFQPGNPDPTPEQIDEYTPYLINEIRSTNPSLCVVVGRFAARWALGENADLDMVHGIPQRPGALDASRAARFPPHCTIIPVIHPASAFYGDPEAQAKSRMLVMWDYSQVAETIKLINSGKPIPYPIDEYEGQEIYSDVTGGDLKALLSPAWTHPDEIQYLSIDTEDDFSIQVSWKPGTAYTLRLCQPDLQVGISTLQSLVDSGIEVITHDADTPQGCLYDVRKCLEVGLDLRRARLFNTMYNLRLYRVEPAGLKPASYRFCGMRLDPYTDLIEGIGKERQLTYLKRILQLSDCWPSPITRQVFENDGTSQLYTPEKITTTVSRIIHDVESGKLDKDNLPTNPFKRWYGIGKKWKIGREIRKPIEDVLGPMPTANLNHVPLEDAIRYACLHGDSIVQTELGPIKIKKLVELRYKGRVWSLDESGHRVLKRVNGWYRIGGKTNSDYIDWYSLDTEFTRQGRWGSYSSRFTHDHRLLTKEYGWKEISEICPGDHIATGIKALTWINRQVVFGSILGDGTLTRRNDGGWIQFRMSHSKSQLSYLEWKRSLLWESEVYTAEGKEVNIRGRDSQRQKHYTVNCKSNPELIRLREIVYSGDKNETVVSEWADEIDDLGLAIWYQDDGTLVSGKYARLYTLSMKLESIKYLINLLDRKFGIKASYYIAKSGDDVEYSFGGYVLTIGIRSAAKFFDLISRYVHPHMQYKLPEQFRGRFSSPSDNAQYETLFAKVTSVYKNPVSAGRRGGLTTSYCIDVEDTHNFITSNNEVAHNCRDADATGRLATKLKIRNQQLGLTSTMSEAMETIPMFFEMQENGMYASRAKFEDLSSFCQSRMSQIGTKLSISYFDCQPFNPNSTDQVGELLIKRNLKPAKYTNTVKNGIKLPSASKKSIEQYRYKDEAIGLVFDWKELEHVDSSFRRPLLETFPDGADYHNVKTVLQIAHTETRRPSSRDPNLLNIPDKTDIGKMVRACFIAPPGQKLVAADLSQIELRCFAHVSRSKFLVQKFLSGCDVHKETAIAVFGTPTPTSTQRKAAKTINFGILYGQQKWGLYDQLRMRGLDQFSMEEGEKLRHEVLRLFGADVYFKEKVKQARDQGYVKDISGMRHYLPNLYSREDKLRAEAERQVISYLIQSMAQYMIQRSMAHLMPIIWSMQDAGLDVLPRLQVYDELIFSCDEDLTGILSDTIVDSLVNHCGIRLRVPVVAEAKVADSWEQLK